MTIYGLATKFLKTVGVFRLGVWGEQSRKIT